MPPHLKELRALVPPLLASSYKGLCGKVAVIGGCREYTGAPFFAAMTALRVGADLSHVFCTRGAAPVIKAYSPELIVHPYLPDSEDASATSLDVTLALLRDWIPRFNSIVIGPGLGRDPKTLAVVRHVFLEARDRKIPLVIDADGLWLVNSDPSLVEGYSRAILTPNPVEFQRLAKVMGVAESVGDMCAEQIARRLRGPLIMQKGNPDVITNGESKILCDEPGSNRRCGGQGDVLSGTIAVFAAWAHLASIGKLPGTEGLPSTAAASEPEDDVARRLLLGTYAAAQLVRRSSRVAFERRGRAMLATDMIDVLGAEFAALYDSADRDRDSDAA